MQHLKKLNQLLRHGISVPIIYAMIIPMFMVDVLVEFYHRTCFYLYGLPYVKRKNYIRIDRHRLEYLDWLQKINCAYCGYANGLTQYVSKILAETELYWCGIRHERNGREFNEPSHHREFVNYGDEEGFKNKYL